MTDEVEPEPSADWRPKMPRDDPDGRPTREHMIAGRIQASAPKKLTSRQADLKALADATRLLVNRLVATDAPDEVIRAATVEVAAAADRFAGYHQGSLYGFGESANAGGYDMPMYDHSPLIGIGNPLAPPLQLRQDGDVLIGTVTFGGAYEGPPGCVHGGYIAAGFDEVLGATQSMSGAPGMTGTLSIRYESPTPLHTELRYEGRLVGVERRKIFTEGLLYAGDQLTARAEGLFISMKSGNFIQLLDERKARQPGQDEADQDQG
ncbi:MAG: hypothetical protein JWM05_215 [Acidimicrobiales bacterium]|nr:hypothetical protein [Acidimicrobiales bacterium]